jgi:uncharacterized membrane protein HdeD (DUF308 family)
MSTPENPVTELNESVRHELHRLRKEWWWFLLLGILLVLCGVIALSCPFISTIGVVIVLGAALLVSGIATIVGAFWAGKWSGFFLQLLVGILYAVAGFTMMDEPGIAVSVLTLFLAAFFVVVGIFRIVVSLSEKFAQWGWSLLSGFITLLLGVVIFKNYEAAQLWVIGLLVGIELIFNGWTWIMLSLSVRNLPVEES